MWIEVVCFVLFFFFFKQKTAYEMLRSLVGSEMCIRDRITSVDHPGTGPTRGLGQPDRARVAQLLRPVLPDRVAAPHPPDQRLHPEVRLNGGRACESTPAGSGLL